MSEEWAKSDRGLQGRQKMDPSWIVSQFLFCVIVKESGGTYCGSGGLIRYNNEDSPETVISLLGRLQREHHTKQHLLPSKGATGSKIRI